MIRHRMFEVEKILINPVIYNCFDSVLVLFLASSQLHSFFYRIKLLSKYTLSVRCTRNAQATLIS
jgi:hypothetical protein